MLQAIREGAQGFFSWVILVMITVPFALWGVNNYFGDGQEKEVASVNGRDFFQTDVNRALQPLKQRFNEALQSGLVSEGRLRRQALDSLVLQELLTQEAQKRNMVISDAFVRQNVMKIEAFQTEKRFDKRRYENLLSARGLSSRGFSEQIRQSKLIEQLQKGVSESALQSDRAVKEFYRLRNQERVVSYFVVPSVSADVYKPSNEEIADYYRSHNNEFLTDEQLSVEYVELSLALLAGEISIDNEALLAAYEEQKNSFVAAEKRRVSHILFVVEDSKDAEAVKSAKEKATKARAALEAGEDFAALAKKLSDDHSTAEDGGKLGFIERGLMDKAFEEAAYSLAQGEVSQPVRSQYGFHLIRLDGVEGEKVRPFEAVKVELLASLKRQEAEDLLYEKMEQMAEAAFESPDSLETVAELLGLKIQVTPIFTRNKGIELAGDPSFRAAAFSDEVLGGKNSEPLELSGERAIVMHLKSREEAGVRSLGEVHDEIVTKLARQTVLNRQEIFAKKLFGELKQGTQIADLAESNSVKLLKPGAVMRDNALLPQELTRKAFGVAHPMAGQSIPLRVVTLSGKQIIAALENVTDGDIGKVEVKELEAAKEFLADSSGESQLEASLLFLRDGADVKITAKREE